MTTSRLIEAYIDADFAEIFPLAVEQGIGLIAPVQVLGVIDGLQETFEIRSTLKVEEGREPYLVANFSGEDVEYFGVDAIQEWLNEFAPAIAKLVIAWYERYAGDIAIAHGIEIR